MPTNLVRCAVAFVLVPAMSARAVSQTAAARQTVITGTVRDDRNAPLAGALVTLVSGRSLAETNERGEYQLVVPTGAADRSDSITVVARRIGFERQSRRIASGGATPTVDFRLVPVTLNLESVVVTSAGEARAPSPMRGRGKGEATPATAMALADASDAKSAVRERATARTDGTRGAALQQQASRAGVLTAAVWDDAAHWPEYARFLRRAEERSWNPWGLEVGQGIARPASTVRRPRSSRRALNLGFLVDATGSMGDELAFLQTELRDIVRRVRAAEPGLDLRLSVVFYRDRGDAFITRALPFTRDVDAAVSFISTTSADGGGDYPEDLNAGLEAMMRQRWSRDAVPQMLFLLADAPPKQYAGADYTYHEAIQDASAGGVAIYPVAASGVDKPTEFLFRAMAVMTGGKYVFLTDDSGVGDHHEEPDISGYTVERLNDLMVREIRSFVAAHGVGQRVAGTR